MPILIGSPRLPKAERYFRYAASVAYRQASSGAFKNFKEVIKNPLLQPVIPNPYIDVGGNPGQTSLLNGLLAYWRLESGEPTLDVNGLNGLTNTTVGTFEVAKINNGFRCPTLNSIAESALNAIFNVNEFTISFWLKINAFPTGSPKSVLSKSGNDGGGLDGWQFVIGTTSTVAISVSKDGLTHTSGAVTITTGTLYFVVGRYRTSDTTTIFTIYDSSSLLAQNGAASTNYSPASTFKLTIGDNAFGLNFTIDEIAFWDRCLADSEVGRLWNSGAGLAYPF